MLKPTIEPGSVCCSGLVRADVLRTVAENCATFEAEDLATGRACLLHELWVPGVDPSLARHFQLAVRRLRDFADSPLAPLIYTFTGVSSFYLVEAIPEGPALDRISPPLAGDELAGAFRAILRALAALHGADPPLFHGALQASHVFPSPNSYGVVLSQPEYVLRWLTGGHGDAGRNDVTAAAWLTALLGSNLPDYGEDIQTLPLRAASDWILSEDGPQPTAARALRYFEDVRAGVAHFSKGDTAEAQAVWRKALERHRYAPLVELCAPEATSVPPAVPAQVAVQVVGEEALPADLEAGEAGPPPEPQSSEVVEPDPALDLGLLDHGPPDIDVEPVPDPPGYAQLIRLASAVDHAKPVRLPPAAEAPVLRTSAAPILPRIETRKPEAAPEPELWPDPGVPANEEPNGSKPETGGPATKPAGAAEAPEDAKTQQPPSARPPEANEGSERGDDHAPTVSQQTAHHQEQPRAAKPETAPTTRVRREQIVVKAARATPASFPSPTAAASRTEFATSGTWRPAREPAMPAKAAHPPAASAPAGHTAPATKPEAAAASPVREAAPPKQAPAATPMASAAALPETAPKKPTVATPAAPSPATKEPPPTPAARQATAPHQKPAQAPASTSEPAVESPAEAYPNVEPEPTSRWMLIAAPIAATLLLAGGGIYMMMSRSNAKPPELPARPAVVQAAPALPVQSATVPPPAPLASPPLQQHAAPPPKPVMGNLAPNRPKPAAAQTQAPKAAAAIPEDPRQQLCTTLKLAGPDCQSSAWVSRCAASGWSGERCLDERRKRFQACMDLGGTVDECAVKHR